MQQQHLQQQSQRQHLQQQHFLEEQPLDEPQLAVLALLLLALKEHLFKRVTSFLYNATLLYDWQSRVIGRFHYFGQV
ncbi:hypothetical protein [Marininema halotolerans]|uniref:Uncharacterized protein n=1 Tax=Marininema halotolerans TaxID=1155944 RepID=A0A1I6TNZ5_9BACL|nr:hypothetical protein [Marininema halotolerans]SFS90895.1 hypothetical protein SAMN05444972_110179 [Marininema halotolerans]